LLAFFSPQAHAQWTVNGRSYSLANGSATLGGSDYGMATSYSQTGGTVSGSTLEFGYVAGGESDPSTSLSYNLSAGAFSISNLTLGVTGSFYGSGYFYQTGGTASIAGTLRLGAGNGSNTGQYALSGGALTTGALLLTGKNSLTNARFALNGGTLVTSNITTGASGYTYGLLIFNGGTLQADANAGSPGSGWINSGTTAYVSTGGARIDTGATDRTINAALLRDPFLADNQPDAGLTKLGAGTLTLTGASTYTGNTTIAGGAIEFGFPSALGASTNQVVLDGGGLRWASGTTSDISSRLATIGAGGGIFDTNGNNVTFASALSGAGALTKSGAGTLTLNAASTYTGAFTVSAGTLSLGNSLALQASSVTLSGSGALDVNVISAVTLGNLNATSFALQNDYPAPLALTLGGGNTTATTATAFSGAGSLVKTGSGTITLSGANTHTGGTSVSAGVLQFAAAAALPSTGTLAVGSGATAAFNVGGTGEFTQTDINGMLGSASFQSGSLLGLDTTNASGGQFIFSSAISGSVGLTKLGGNLLTLTGANTYTGGTTVSAGTLAGDTASLQGNITNNAAVNFDQASDGTYAGNISGTGSLTKSSAGNVTLTGTNTYSGGTTINGGTLTGNSVSLQGNIVDNAAIVFNQAATGTYAGVVSGTGTLTKSGAGNLTLGATNTYTGGTVVNGGTLALVNGGSAGAIVGSLTVNSGATLLASTSNAFGYGTGTKVDSVAINGGTLNYTGSGDLGWGIAYTLNSGALLTSNGGVSSTSSASDFSFGGNTSVSVTSGAATIAGHVDLRGDNGITNVNFTVASGATLNVTAGISSHAPNSVTVGPVGFTKLGAGAMILTGANSYSGTTAINAGTLQAGNASALGSGTISFGGGTLQYGSGITTDFSSRFSTAASQQYNIDTNGNNVTLATALTSSGGALSKAGSGTLTLSAANTYAGGTTVSGGTLDLITGGGTGAIRGALNIGTGATVESAAVDALGYIDGTKVDSIMIDGGTLNNSAAGNNGWGVAYTLSNGALLTSNGGVSSTSAASAFSFGNSTTVNVPYGTATIAGHVDLRGDLGDTAVGFTVASGATLNVTADISNTNGSLGVTKLGAGAMTLTGTNTYSGTTAINAGTLQAGNASALGSGTISFGGGTLQYGSGVTTDFSPRFSTAASQQYKIDTNGNAVTLATALTSSGGSLTKSGSGTLTLPGANTYTGATNISAGTLVVTGSLANTVLTVAGGATLGGKGSLGGLATIQTSGILAPGEAGGTLTFANGLTLENDAALSFDLGSTSSLVAITGGALTINGDLTINFANSGGFAVGSYTLLNWNGATISGLDLSRLHFGTTVPGYAYDFSTSGSSLFLLVAVPESSNWAAASGALLALILLHRRARRTSGARSE
jgi:autotransporter-associated beta strand protein